MEVKGTGAGWGCKTIFEITKTSELAQSLVEDQSNPVISACTSMVLWNQKPLITTSGYL